MASSIRSLILVAAAGLALVSCTNEQADPVGTSALALSLTAAPVGPLIPVPPEVSAARVAHVYLTIQEVDVHVATTPTIVPLDHGVDEDTDVGGRWIATDLRTPRTIDLMTLQGGVAAALDPVVSLPAGQITQIRLVLDRAGDHQVVLTDGTRCTLDLSQVPSTGVKIANPFPPVQVGDGTPVRIVVAVDLEHSLSVTGMCSYRLDPVINIYTVEYSDFYDGDHNGVDNGAPNAATNDNHGT